MSLISSVQDYLQWQHFFTEQLELFDVVSSAKDCGALLEAQRKLRQRKLQQTGVLSFRQGWIKL